MGRLARGLPERSRGPRVLRALAAGAEPGHAQRPDVHARRRARRGGAAPESRSSGRRALHHPRLRRPGARPARASGRAGLLEDRPRRVSRAAHDQPHLRGDGDVGRDGRRQRGRPGPEPCRLDAQPRLGVAGVRLPAAGPHRRGPTAARERPAATWAIRRAGTPGSSSWRCVRTTSSRASAGPTRASRGRWTRPAPGPSRRRWTPSRWATPPCAGAIVPRPTRGSAPLGVLAARRPAADDDDENP